MMQANNGNVTKEALNAWCELQQDEILKLVPEPQTFLVKQISRSIKPVKFFEPEQQPQDFEDLISETVRLFFQQISEISTEVKNINKKHLKLHAMLEAERQVKKDYMRQLVIKQREIMS